MDKDMRNSFEKVRTFAKDILAQCQDKCLIYEEVKMLPGEMSRQIEETINKKMSSEIFFK